MAAIHRPEEFPARETPNLQEVPWFGTQAFTAPSSAVNLEGLRVGSIAAVELVEDLPVVPVPGPVLFRVRE